MQVQALDSHSPALLLELQLQKGCLAHWGRCIAAPVQLGFNLGREAEDAWSSLVWLWKLDQEWINQILSTCLSTTGLV